MNVFESSYCRFGKEVCVGGVALVVETVVSLVGHVDALGARNNQPPHGPGLGVNKALDAVRVPDVATDAEVLVVALSERVAVGPPRDPIDVGILSKHVRDAEALASALHGHFIEVDAQDLADLARLDQGAGFPQLGYAPVDVAPLPRDAVRLTCGDHAVGVDQAGGDRLLGHDSLRAGRFRGKNDHVRD